MYLESLERLVKQFIEDKHPNKTNLLVGVYKTEDGKAYAQPTVKEVRVETRMTRA